MNKRKYKTLEKNIKEVFSSRKILIIGIMSTIINYIINGNLALFLFPPIYYTLWVIWSVIWWVIKNE